MLALFLRNNKLPISHRIHLIHLLEFSIIHLVIITSVTLTQLLPCYKIEDRVRKYSCVDKEMRKLLKNYKI